MLLNLVLFFFSPPTGKDAKGIASSPRAGNDLPLLIRGGKSHKTSVTLI